MKTGIIDSNLVLANFRLDGKFHLSEGLVVRKLIHLSPYGYCLIEDVTSNIYCPGIFRRNYTTSGIPFLGGGDIQKADYNSGKYLRENTTSNNEILKIKKGWTLVTCGGTIGDTVFANDLLAKCWISQHVMRVIPAGIKEGMLFAYLASKYGHKLLTTNTYGSVIPTLNASNIAELPIPKFPESFQKEVDDLIQKSAQLREEATSLLKEAQLQLESRFEGQVIRKSGAINIANITSDAMSRIDASYHLSNSTVYERIIVKGTYKKLSELCSDIFGGGRAKRYYTENKEKGVPFLSNTDLGRANPLRSCKYSLRNKGFDEGAVLKHGMIVTGRVGAIGQTQYIGKSYEEMQIMGSDNVIRIVPSQNSGYLFAYLSSKIGNSMFWKYATGGVQPFISSSMVGNILVPIYDDDIIEKCNQLVELYSEKREQSNILEDTAISMIEKEIEKWK